MTSTKLRTPNSKLIERFADDMRRGDFQINGLHREKAVSKRKTDPTNPTLNYRLTTYEIEEEAARGEIKALWEKYDLVILLQGLADVIYSDTRLVETTGEFPAEVERKDHLVGVLREEAKRFTE